MFYVAVNDMAMIPATFILYQNDKLFQSKRLIKESTSKRKRVVGTRIISATIEGIEVYDLPRDQPVASAYLQTEVQWLVIVIYQMYHVHACKGKRVNGFLGLAEKRLLKKPVKNPLKNNSLKNLNRVNV